MGNKRKNRIFSDPVGRSGGPAILHRYVMAGIRQSRNFKTISGAEHPRRSPSGQA